MHPPGVVIESALRRLVRHEPLRVALAITLHIAVIPLIVFLSLGAVVSEVWNTCMRGEVRDFWREYWASLVRGIRGF